MKTLLSSLVFVALLLPQAQAQSLAFDTPATTEFSCYSTANFINYRGHKIRSRKTIVGGIVGLSGCALIIPGLLLYSLGSIQDYEAPPNYGMQHAGIGLMVVGGVMGIVGGAIGISGKAEDRRKYGWHMIAPKNNELGIAYNF